MGMAERIRLLPTARKAEQMEEDSWEVHSKEVKREAEARYEASSYWQCGDSNDTGDLWQGHCTTSHNQTNIRSVCPLLRNPLMLLMLVDINLTPTAISR